MQRRLSALKRYRRSTLLAVMVLVVSLLTTYWAWRLDRDQAQLEARTEWTREIDRTRMAIRARFEVYEDALYGTRSFFEASPTVTRKMFAEYVANLDLANRYPGIQGIGFAEFIHAHDLSAHIRLVRREGFPEYAVMPRGERESYSAIVYLEPFDWRNRRAHGYDMFSEPVRRAAMEHARDHATAAMSRKVTLVQETDQDVQPGFLVYLPVYRKELPAETLQQRRVALAGWIYSPFRVFDFLREALGEPNDLAMFEVYSGTEADEGSLLYRSPGWKVDANHRPAYTHIHTLEFGGQRWTMRFATTPAFDTAAVEGQNPVILPAGIAISILLFGFTMSVGQTERRAVRLADTITAKLRENEERFRSITETATDAIITTNAEGKITYFNPAAERIFRRRAAQTVGQQVTELFPDGHQLAAGIDEQPRLDGVDGGAVSIGTTTEIMARRADGAEFPVAISWSSWQAGDVFYTAILRDITQRKASEAEILKLNKELTEALYRSEKLAITGRLVATIAHEINNPLEALMNILFVLERQVDDKSMEFIKMAQDQVALLTNISRQTLAPYREAKFPVVTNVSELLDDVVSLLRPKLLKANVQVVRRYPASVLLTIYPSELRQVFTNLIANAIDAMGGGGRLTLTVTTSAKGVCISVADTGSGISREHLTKLFEPFFTTKADRGTGVGLWVVNEIVRKLGGTIEVATSTAQEDHGSTFTIALPPAAGSRESAEDTTVVTH